MLSLYWLRDELCSEKLTVAEKTLCTRSKLDLFSFQYGCFSGYITRFMGEPSTAVSISVCVCVCVCVLVCACVCVCECIHVFIYVCALLMFLFYSLLGLNTSTCNIHVHLFHWKCVQQSLHCYHGCQLSMALLTQHHNYTKSKKEYMSTNFQYYNY